MTDPVDELWRGFETPDFLASHLEHEFHSKASGFMQAMRLVYDSEVLPNSSPDVKAKSQGRLDREIKQVLSEWFQHPDRPIEDRSDTQEQHYVQAKNHTTQGNSTRGFYWPPTLEESPEARQASLQQFWDILKWTEDRFLFITRSGYIGVGPTNVVEGDKVFIPLGCCTPLIIRKIEKESFEVIGDSYVCGMMQGEMIEKLSESATDLTDVVLC